MLARKRYMQAVAAPLLPSFRLPSAACPGASPATDPTREQAYKDSSAAAIAASGLLRLGALADEPRYTEAGVELLAALADGYLGWEGPQEQRVEALLREGSFNVPAGHYGTGLIWGDWYFLDALSQLLLAPGGPPGNRSACAP